MNDTTTHTEDGRIDLYTDDGLLVGSISEIDALTGGFACLTFTPGFSYEVWHKNTADDSVTSAPPAESSPRRDTMDALRYAEAGRRAAEKAARKSREGVRRFSGVPR